MVILLDASVLIEAERGSFDFKQFLDEHSDDAFALSAITASEMLHGIHRATTRHRARREAFVEGLLAQIPVLPFDLLAARIHARLWAEAASKGLSLGAHDLLIGAIALASGSLVATHDKRSFPKIPGLDIVLV
jgi:tRNA(fMet)-specific endonuclease VapC